MKPRDLLPVIERVRRATTNGDMLTICDALSKRLSHEIATSEPRPKFKQPDSTSESLDEMRKAAGFIGAKPMPRTAMDAVVEHAEGGRKPATGKAKRAIAKLAARKAARKAKP